MIQLNYVQKQYIGLLAILVNKDTPLLRNDAGLNEVLGVLTLF